MCHSAQVTLVNLSNRMLSCSGQKCCQATMSHKHLFGGSCWRNHGSYVSWGSSFLWRRRLTVMTRSEVRHFHFTSSLFLKLSGIKEGLVCFDTVWLFFFFSCSHSRLPAKTRLHRPGEWILEWRRVITVPYQWLTEARLPPACHCPVALASPAFLQRNAVPLHCCWHQVR